MRFIKYAAPIALTAWAVYLFFQEKRNPLRAPVEPQSKHLGRNLAIASATALTLSLSETPLVKLLTRSVSENRLGLLQNKHLPRPLYLVLSVVLMDYTLYIWHVLSHRVPFLWRFHVAHHIDRDLDASTALRFHFGEMTISTLWRLLQVRFLGIDRPALQLWQNFLIFCILFHHSNVKLPKSLDKILKPLIMTPNLHTIHHSIVEAETNSNWSSGLTIWDKLHGTYRDDVEPNEVIIGVPAFRDQKDVELESVLTLPFRDQPDSWKSEDDLTPVRKEDGRLSMVPTRK